MTALEVVEIFDRERKNDVSENCKKQWISELDLKIANELLKNRDCEKTNPFTMESDFNSELNAPKEYSEIYVIYLKMKMDYMLGEIQRYNNSSTVFNRLFYEMSNFISRNFKVCSSEKIKVEFNV